MRKPSADEKWIVWRCLMESGLLVGSVDEVWGHRNAWLMLGTLRECMDAISLIVSARLAVNGQTVKVCVLQADGIESVPYALSDMADFLCEDDRARRYWQVMTPDEHFPHRCPRCGCAAFVGFNLVDCRAGCR